MGHVADPPRWSPQDVIQKLRMAADRLCPTAVLADAPSNTAGGTGEVTLSRAVALCDAEGVSPDEDAGRYLLVVGILHETRKRLRVMACLAEPAESKEIERRPETWVEQRIPGVEDEIAEWWGEPVVRLIRQRREQPEFFEQVLATFEPDQEPCLNASM